MAFSPWMTDTDLFHEHLLGVCPRSGPARSTVSRSASSASEGVIDIEDTHRDLVMATNVAQGRGLCPRRLYKAPDRHVEFLTSYPPGDLHDGQLWGPMREETNAWYQRLYTGARTPHATAADGHRNL